MVEEDLMVAALRPVKDGIATVAEVTEAIMKILWSERFVCFFLFVYL